VAIEQRLVARVRWRREGGQDVLLGGTPDIGDSLLLGESGKPILTSAVRCIEACDGTEGTDG
jgi:hypothetical protein